MNSCPGALFCASTQPWKEASEYCRTADMLAAHLIDGDWILAESQSLAQVAWRNIVGQMSVVAELAEAGLCKTLSTETVRLNQIVMPLLCNILDLGFCHSYDLADICAPQSDLNRMSCSHFQFNLQQASQHVATSRHRASAAAVFST
jgi:hypothetical protein